MKKIAIFGMSLVGLALIVGVSGCGTGSSGGSPESALSFTNSTDAAEDPAFDMQRAAEMDGGSNTAIDPMLIVTGDATVVVSDPSTASEDFQKAVHELGGTIDSTWESDTKNDQSSSITARVPSDKFAELTSRLSDFGKVEYQNTSSADVGQQYVDLDARVSALEDSLKRLSVLADQAETTEDLLQAEEMLTNRQAELDSLRQQLQWLDDQVAMSTLTVTFTTEFVHSGDGFSWEHAWELFMQSITAFAYLVLVALPWLLFATVVFFVVRWLVRRLGVRAEPRRSAKWVRSVATSPAPAQSGDPSPTKAQPEQDNP